MKNQEYYLSKSALSVLQKRYFKEGEDWVGLCDRVSRAIAKSEQQYNKFFEVMVNRLFLPNTPALINAGTEVGQLAACFVLPVEDSIEGIFNSIKNAALIHKSGGGTGFSFSRLREANTKVKSTNGVASGPVSFMEVFNAATGAIKQGGVRRGANMGLLRVDHPDIMEFITCKKNTKNLTNFNISVAITDEFMNAVDKDENFELISPVNGETIATVKAKKIFDAIAHYAWLNGEPGIVFIDEINMYNPTPLMGDIEATNPCGETPLLPNEACILGSIDISKHVISNKLDTNMLSETIVAAVVMLDNMITFSKYPLPEIEEAVNATRKIGLGVMGWADTLAKLGIPYESEKALSLAHEVSLFIQYQSHTVSKKLADSFGGYPVCVEEVLERNATVTTIAPTGSISMIADCSSGIEPFFSLAYTKTVIDGTEYNYINETLVNKLTELELWNEDVEKEVLKTGSIQNIESIPDNIKTIFKTAQEISPEQHVKMQAAFQEWVDNAVSKTINLPSTATEEDVKNIYMLAWKLKCKGITVYRDGSRESQVLSIGYSPKEVKDHACPECGVQIEHKEGCALCPSCGWTVCST